MSLTDEEEEDLRLAAVVFLESAAGSDRPQRDVALVLWGYLLGQLQQRRTDDDERLGDLSSEDAQAVRDLAEEYERMLWHDATIGQAG